MNLFIYELEDDARVFNLVRETNDNYNKPQLSTFLSGYCRFIREDNKIVVVQKMKFIIFSLPLLLFKPILKIKLWKLKYKGHLSIYGNKQIIEYLEGKIW